MIVGGYAKMFSLFPFKEVEISQIKGNIDKSDTNIKTACIGKFFKNFFIIFDTYSFQNTEYSRAKVPEQ